MEQSPDVSSALPGIARSGRSWRRLGRTRLLPRPRRTLGPKVYWLASKTGFRFSYHRNALVLRGVGGRHGPVLLLRGAAVPPLATDSARAPAPRWTTHSRGLSLDLACLPLPHLPQGRPVWQLTGVERHSACAWANLVAPEHGRPSVVQIDGFVAGIAVAMAERGEQLTAVSVQIGSGVPAAALPSLHASGIEVRRTQAQLPDRSAVALHGLFVRRHWGPRSEEADGWELPTLEHELQGWIRARNLEALAAL